MNRSAIPSQAFRAHNIFRRYNPNAIFCDAITSRYTRDRSRTFVRARVSDVRSKRSRFPPNFFPSPVCVGGSRKPNYSPSCRSNILIHVVEQTAGRARARARTRAEIGKPSASSGHIDGKLVFRGMVREQRGRREKERERKRA